MAFPEPTGSPEGCDSAFCADACTCENNNLFHGGESKSNNEWKARKKTIQGLKIRRRPVGPLPFNKPTN
jgi:hypothetical protein